MNRRSAIALTGSALLSGCAAVGPNFMTPKAALTERFAGGGSALLLDAASLRWWRELDDPLLNKLVERGLNQNLDIEAGVERIRQADAAIGQTGRNAQTSGSIGAQAGRQRTEGNEATSNNSITANANYVFDLFGGIRRGQQQAVANFESAQYDVGTVRLAYLFDIVNAYVQARFFQASNVILQETVRNRRRTLSSVNLRLNAGDATELDLARARTELSTAQADLPLLKSSFESNVFRIATLLAEPAGPLLATMQKVEEQPLPDSLGEQGVPADLLRNRPSIRVAEKNLAAATAAIGVAQAALYPSLSLSGSVSEGTFDTWSFGPSLQLPLLNRGFLKASRNIAISQAQQAEIGYRNAVLLAVEDVQTNLTTTRQWELQLRAVRTAQSGSQDVLRLSRQSYDAGAIILTDVLEAERFNATNDLAVADACREYALSWARLQVASGKGWYGGEQAPAVEVLDVEPSVEEITSN